MLDVEPKGSRTYILNISEITESEIDYGGEKALNLGHLYRLGAPVPSGFVVTSKTFDDFLFANDLITRIGEINSQVSHGQLNPVKAENLIAKLLVSGSYPNLIKEMLYRAYNLLTNGKPSIVLLDISVINSHLKESLTEVPEAFITADSFEDFLIKLKHCWLLLFKKQAMTHRVTNRYKGIISTAVTVSKFVQPEVSGTSYTLRIDNADPASIELRAVYGIGNMQLLNSHFPDRYIYDRKVEQVTLQNMNEQDWMLVLRDSKPMKLSIAKERRKQPKLNQAQIMKLARITANLKDYFKNELKIDWYYQSGKFVFSNLTRLREQEVLKARNIFTTQPQRSSVQTNNINPLQERFNLLPLDKLTRVIQGSGNSKGLAYGRVKIIRNSKDLEEARGTQILVMNKSIRNLSLDQVHYRGLVIEAVTSSETINIPIISGASDATRLLLENEIVTIDTDSGNIYLGAGYLPVVKPVVEKIVDSVRPETINTKEIKLTIQRPVTTGIFRTPTIPNVSQAEQNWLPETVDIKTEAEAKQPEKNIVTKQIEEEWFLKQPVFTSNGSEQKTGCDYWQIINPENPAVLSSTKGQYFRLNKILESLDLDKYELVRNNPLKRKFIEFMGHYFTQFGGSSELVVLLDIEASAKDTLDKGEVFDFQLELIKFLKNKTELSRVSIVLPDVRTEKELVTMKKLVTASGLRRSATFKVLAEIASPLAGISVEKIINNGVDAIVLDLDKFLSSLGIEDSLRVNPEVSDFIVEIINKVSKSTSPVYLIADNVALNDDNLEKFIQSGLSRFIFPESKITELGAIIANMEIKVITKTSKRGRKRKEINYGF